MTSNSTLTMEIGSMAGGSSATGRTSRTRLIDIAANYLKDSPYPGTIQAQVNSRGHYTLFLILLKSGTLNVYRHVRNADRAETREHPAGSAPPRDKEGAA